MVNSGTKRLFYSNQTYMSFTSNSRDEYRWGLRVIFIVKLSTFPSSKYLMSSFILFYVSYHIVQSFCPSLSDLGLIRSKDSK